MTTNVYAERSAQPGHGDECAEPSRAMGDVTGEIVGQLVARAGEADRLRTMPADLVARLRSAGLFHLAVPRSMGGLELDPVSIIQIIERLSRADGSAGWTVLIGNSAAFMGWLDPTVTAPIVAASPRLISTGVWGPLGRAEPTGDGGFVVSGRWPFSSGCLHADWYQHGFFVMDGDRPATRPDGHPDWRFAYLPARDAQVIDTWNASGLRGTGSHDVTLDGVVVPAERIASPKFDSPRHAGPLMRLGFGPLTATLLVGFPLGVARSVLDEVIALARTHRRNPRLPAAAPDLHAHMLIGQAEGALHAARAFVINVFGDAWATIELGDPISADQAARIDLALRQAMAAARRAADLVSGLAGAAIVYSEHPLGRAIRDLHAADQHIGLRSDGFADLEPTA